MDEVDVNELEEMPGNAEEVELNGDIDELLDKAICAARQFIEAVSEIAWQIAKEFTRAIGQITKAISVAALTKFDKTATAYRKVLLDAYPNKHIVWLALHHKKKRVRKKNMRRIIKYYKGD